MTQAETNIVTRLFKHLDAAGFSLAGVQSNGEPGTVATYTAERAIGLVREYGAARVYFAAVGGPRRWVDLIVGNGTDIVSDWCEVANGDPANAWNAAMNEFVAHA